MPKIMKISLILFAAFGCFMYWINSGKDIYLVDKTTNFECHHSHVRKFAEVHVKEGRLFVDGYLVDILNDNDSVLVK